MTLKQRLEALEDQLSHQDHCPQCGGVHTRNWVEAVQTATDGLPLCACTCCQWIADLGATPTPRSSRTAP